MIGLELTSNFAKTVLASPINASATTITLFPGAGALFPNPSGGNYFRILITDIATSNYNEIVLCTARSGDVLTVTRNAEGTLARSWLAGDIIENVMTAGAFSELRSQGLNSNTAIGALSLGSVTTGANNSVVGTSSLQSNTTGTGNSTLGYQSARYLANGSTALTIATNSTYIGSNTKASANNVTNETVIGYNAIGSGNNTITIGGSAVTETVIPYGNLGIGVVPSGAYKLEVAGVISGTSLNITTAYPTVQPTLNLDFANSRLLDPRITFVRNSTATYYDGQTTALAEQNLLLQSQTFATTWVTSNTTLGSLTTAPDGTTTAYPLTASAINGTLLQTFTATANAYTFSIYIQRVTGTGNIDITVDGTTYATQTTTGTWTRFNITTTPSAGSKTAGIRLTVSGDVVNIWGAQLEQRSSVTAYTPTTTAAITNYIPVLMTAPANVARFDCDPITRNSLGLLIEESRTNLVLQSQFASGFTFVRTTQNINTIIAPDGTQTASKIIPTNISGSHTLYKSVTVASGASYTWSGYFKAGEYNTIHLNCQASASIYIVKFNLTSGTSTNVSGTGTSSITPVGNGWYRCTATATTASTLGFWQFDIYDNSGNTVYTGDDYSGIYIWGAQLEAGSFATSYIPTVASTVTRAADAASMTGTNFSSWYNQAQGSLYAESDDNGANNNGAATLFNIGASSNNAIAFYGNGTLNATRLLVRLDTGGYVINTTSSTTTQPIKQAASFKDGAVSCTANGILFVTNVNVNIPHNLDTLYIGYFPGTAGYLTGHIRKLSYYPVALSSSNLVALTS